MEQLRDIRGLDALPWWPLPPGWWFLMAALLSMLLLAYILHYWWRQGPGRDWRSEAVRQVGALRERLAWADARTLAGELSELLRRIAIARVGRRGCAGLVNEAWLAWLEAHDPNGFAWRTEGQILIRLPYAPPGDRSSAARLEPLVDAAEQWAQSADEPTATAFARQEAGLARVRGWVNQRLGRSRGGELHV